MLNQKIFFCYNNKAGKSLCISDQNMSSNTEKMWTQRFSLTTHVGKIAGIVPVLKGYLI